MGVAHLTLIDFDEVAIENTSTQIYGTSDIGTPKVEALARYLKRLASADVSPFVGKVDPNTTMAGHICISAVDSIATRKDIWDAIIMNGDFAWYFDARMGAEEMHLFTVDLDDRESVVEYDEILSRQDDEGIADLPCTQKSTFYTGMGAAMLVGKAVAYVAQNRKPPKRILLNLEPLNLIVLE